MYPGNALLACSGRCSAVISDISLLPPAAACEVLSLKPFIIPFNGMYDSRARIRLSTSLNGAAVNGMSPRHSI